MRGGRLVDKTITLPYEVAQVGEEFVRIFKIRNRDMWCIAAWMPVATPRAEVSSDILLKVQTKSKDAMLARRRGESGQGCGGVG